MARTLEGWNLEAVRKPSLWIPALVVAMLLSVVAILAPGLAALLAVAVPGFFLLDLLAHKVERESAGCSRIWGWTMFSFVLHALVGLAITLSGAWTFLGPDLYGYHNGAIALTENDTATAAVFIEQGKEGFVHILAFFYSFFGPEQSAGLILNAGLAAALVPVVTRLTDEMFGSGHSRYVPPMVVFIPSFLVWTSQLLREAGVLLLIAVAALGAARLLRRFDLGAVVQVGAALVLLLTFRSHVALVVAAALLTSLALVQRDVVLRLGIPAGGLALGLILVFGLGLGAAGLRATLDRDLSEVSALREGISAGVESGFDAGVDVSTVSGALGYLPIGLVRTLFGPAPWEIRSAAQAPALVEVAVVTYLWFWIARGVVEARRRTSGVLVLLLPALGIAAALSLFVGNYGLLLRERPQVLILLLPFASLGLSIHRARPDKSRPASLSSHGSLAEEG